jgi:pimeloyl-ACP methyl ester carboxylesterase
MVLGVSGVTAPMQDLIVVLPGMLGSTLAKDDKLIWAPSAGAVLRAITTLGHDIRAMELPEGIGDEHPGDGMQPVGLMPDLHVLPGLWSANIGYDAMLNWLRSRFHLSEAPQDDTVRFANLLPIPYDWRLSNRYNGRRLKSIVEPALEKWRSQHSAFENAKVVFICHSMGGLVARWYIDREGGAEITRKLITLGTPHRGALNALEQLVNGAHVGLGPFAVKLTRFARSLPSLYQLLPEYACIEAPQGLVKTTEMQVPDLATSMIDDAMRFHAELDGAQGDGYDLHPIVGFRQPTKTTARIDSGRVMPMDTIASHDEGGDGTVPRLAATPARFRPDHPTIRAAAERHGALQSNSSVLDELEFVLGARSEPYRVGGQSELSVTVEELIMRGEPLVLSATPSDGSRTRLRATVNNEGGHEVASALLEPARHVTIDPLPPGGYTITVGAVGTAVTRIAPVTCPILVWDTQENR